MCKVDDKNSKDFKYLDINLAKSEFNKSLIEINFELKKCQVYARML